MYEILEKICIGKGTKEDLENLDNLANNVKKASVCGLGQTAPNPVLSTMKYFYSEYEDHIKEEGKCIARECKDLTKIMILKEACKACDLCKKACPVNAINGEPGVVHEIDQSKCIKCRSCIAACPFKAITNV